MEYSCPNCGAPLEFKSKFSVYTTCIHCNSNIVRHDMDLELLGAKSALLDDMSPFQPGTSGRYEGRGFYLLGRIKVMYPQGTWSEWYASFDDGQEGWLAEAQGFYMMSFQTNAPDNLPHPDDIRLNSKISIDGTSFQVDDLRKIIYAASEGELPFIFEEGKKGFSVDLRAEGGLFASILFGINDTPEVFKGRYLPFEAFKFENLKELDGWKLT